MTQLTLQYDVVRRHGAARSDNHDKILMQTVKMSEDANYSRNTIGTFLFFVMHFWDRRRNCNKEIKQPGIKQINSIYLVGELVTSYDV